MRRHQARADNRLCTLAVCPKDPSGHGGKRKGAITGRLAALLAAAGLLPLIAQAQEEAGGRIPPPPPTADAEAGANFFGVTGLVDIPSARIAPQGITELGLVARAPYRRVYLRLSPFDWLEVAYRADEATNVLPDGTVLAFDQGRFFGDFFGGLGHAAKRERSFDVKLRLWEEGRIRPALAVGFQDIFGRAAFGGEYVALSKRIGDLDFTAGLGFGYLGSRDHFGNPFAIFSNRYKRRDPDPGPGGINADDFFRGNAVALFGGVEWYTPLPGLSLSAAYAGRDLEREPLGIGETLKERLPVDFALRYRPWPWLDLGLGLLGGRYVTARASLRFDVTRFERLFEKSAVDPYPLAGQPAPGFQPAPDKADSEAEAVISAYLQTRALDPALVSLEGLEAVIVLKADARLDGPAMAALADALFSRLDAQVKRLVIRRQDEPLAKARVFLRDAGGGAAGLLAGGGAEALRLRGRTAVLSIAGAPAELERLAPALPPDVAQLRLTGDARREVRLTPALRARALARLAVTRPGLGEARALALSHAGVLTVSTGGPEGGMEAASVDGNTLDPLLAQSLGVSGLVRLSQHPAVTPDEVARAAAVFAALKALGVESVGLAVGPERWRLWVRSGPPERPARLLGRSLRVLAEQAPPSVTWLEVARTAAGGEAWRVEVLRRDVVQTLSARGSPQEVAAHAAWLPNRTAGPLGQARPAPDYEDEDAHGARFRWGILPSWQAGFGRAQDGLIRGDLYLDLVARLEIGGRLKVEGALRRFLIGNLDELAPPQDRRLPAVRSDIAAFSREGRNAIARLTASYDWNWAPGLTSRISAGLFEPMYGGFGIETTWHRPRSPWILYGELFWVKKRGFSQGLSFQDYSTVTGSLGLVYAFEGGLNIDLSLNRYLARDTGLRLAVSKRLDNGLEIGGWLAGSSRSAREFGRGGNLDKGVFISLPLDGFWPFAAPEVRVTTRLGNLLRDSGQRLQLNERLYERIFAADPARILEQLPDLFY